MWHRLHGGIRNAVRPESRRSEAKSEAIRTKLCCLSLEEFCGRCSRILRAWEGPVNLRRPTGSARPNAGCRASLRSPSLTVPTKNAHRTASPVRSCISCPGGMSIYEALKPSRLGVSHLWAVVARIPANFLSLIHMFPACLSSEASAQSRVGTPHASRRRRTAACRNATRRLDMHFVRQQATQRDRDRSAH